MVVGDTTLWGEWLTIWPSGGWVLLLLPATLRSRSALAASFLAAFTILTTEWPRWPSSGPVAGEKLRLVVWNVGADVGFLESAADLEPDVWMVQEFVKPLSLPSAYRMHATVDPAVITRLPVQVLPARHTRSHRLSRPRDG